MGRCLHQRPRDGRDDGLSTFVSDPGRHVDRARGAAGVLLPRRGGVNRHYSDRRRDSGYRRLGSEPLMHMSADKRRHSQGRPDGQHRRRVTPGSRRGSRRDRRRGLGRSFVRAAQIHGGVTSTTSVARLVLTKRARRVKDAGVSTEGRADRYAMGACVAGGEFRQGLAS